MKTLMTDRWTQDSFEDNVAAALITCFETRIRKNRGAGPNTLTVGRAELMRQAGPYIPGADRVVIAGDESGWEFDLTNDPLPTSGCVGMRLDGSTPADEYGGFFRAIYVRKRQDVGARWHRRAGGQVYELIYMASQNEFVEGERSFFAITAGGRIVACEERVQDGRGRLLTTPAKHLSQVEACASVALQYLADQRFCWTIEAREEKAFVRLGCQEEEVKSLLYARSLPLSETGRRRPILHLIEAHKRRLKNGTDIDIPASARGIQTVEIAGTMFTVRPAAAVLPLLSKPSRDRLEACREQINE